MSVHRWLAAAALALALLGAVTGRAPSARQLRALATDIEAERDHVDALELAQWIRDRRPGLLVFDLREPGVYEQMHIPTAQHATLASLLDLRIGRGNTVVLYSEGGAHSAQGWLLLRAAGVRDVFFLREGMYEWMARVQEPRLALDASAAERAEYERAAELSRYFGGQPMRDVPRAEVPVGYWTGDAAASRPSAAEMVTRARRRGC